MSQPVQKKIQNPSLSLLHISSVSLKTPLFLSLCFSHPSLKLVSRQNRSPLAGAEEIGFSPRRKPPNPTVVFSLAPSLFLSPHQLTRSSPPSSHLSHLTGTSGPIFACRHRCAPISAAPPDFSPPRSHRPPP